ncbi:MAG: fasciclin domain-containing protein, partial [Rhodothermales bacterium]
MNPKKGRFSALATFVLLAGFSMTSIACDDNDGGLVEAGNEPGTIVEVASDGGFNTLVAAVEAAGLVETLQGEGPFTVFAPTDEAFAKLPEGTVESLLKPENKDQLVAVLTYHVVAGEVTS